MKKDNLYLFTLLAISVIVFAIGYISMIYLVKVSTNQFLEIQIQSSKREARELAKLVSYQIDNGTPKDIIVSNIQNSIEGTNIEAGFVCMFNWSGVEICHPNPKKIGQQTSPNESYVKPVKENINTEDFYDLLKNKREVGGIRSFSDGERNSEIIYLYPVKNSDWIIAAHANVGELKAHIHDLKVNFSLVYVLTGVVIILLSLSVVRFLGNYYEKELELKNDKLEEEIIILSKLNSNLSNYKDKISKKMEGDTIDEETSKTKKRILTYLKDKLISIKVDEISFINTEHSITTIVCLDGKKYTSNSSLDELYSSLDSTLFFRANRQFVLSAKGIDEIFRYGNNQLKINTSPKSNTSIIISKNKASEFKKWLDM
jgi:hypothetical protein